MRGRLVRQRRDVQAAEADVGAPAPVVVGERVGAAGGGDVDLDDDEVGLVVEAQPLDVLVLDLDLVVVGPGSAASVASPSGGNSEYLMGRKNGLIASVSAGRIILTFMDTSPGPSRRPGGKDRPRHGGAPDGWVSRG